jgi:hypothetical protein
MKFFPDVASEAGASTSLMPHNHASSLMLIQRALPAGKQHGQGRNTEAIGSFLKA